MSHHENRQYRAYLVRLWREGDAVWRGTLEDPHTGERQAFASVDALLTHIREQTASVENEIDAPTDY